MVFEIVWCKLATPCTFISGFYGFFWIKVFELFKDLGQPGELSCVTRTQLWLGNWYPRILLIWSSAGVVNHAVFEFGVAQLSIGQLSVGQLSVGQLSAGQLSAGQLSVVEFGVFKLFAVELGIVELSVVKLGDFKLSASILYVISLVSNMML
jgi:hypothetical protein